MSKASVSPSVTLPASFRNNNRNTHEPSPTKSQCNSCRSSFRISSHERVHQRPRFTRNALAFDTIRIMKRAATTSGGSIDEAGFRPDS